MMAPPETIGPYQVLRPLSAGGMGQVYVARKTGEGGFEMTCVVKTIRPDHGAEERFTRMFLREARILASLRHQNIVQVLDFGRADGALYLAMEYVDGHDLRAVLLRARELGRPLPLAATLRIAVDALRGLDYAHRRAGPNGEPLNIVHRDLTPANILISREGEVKIADFGIARDAVSDSQTDDRFLKGKLHYMPPEQLEGQALDGRADLFAAGVVLYEMATGRKPFDAPTAAALIAKIARCEYPPASAVAGTPKELDRVIARALAKRREDRFAGAAEMLGELEKLAAKLGSGSGAVVRDCYRELYEATDARVTEEIREALPEGATTSATPPPAEPTPMVVRQARRNPLPWIGVAVAAAVVVVVGWLTLVGLPRSVLTIDASPDHALVQETTPDATPECGTAAPGCAEKPPSLPDKPAKEPTPKPVDKTPVPPAPTPQPVKEAAPGPAPTPEPPPPAPAFGYLVVADLNPYAEVWVDGQKRDTTPTKVKLEAGKHKVHLLNPKIPQSATLTVEVTADKQFVLSAWPK
jgi:serine/threonine-protein kinase